MRVTVRLLAVMVAGCGSALCDSGGLAHAGSTGADAGSGTVTVGATDGSAGVVPSGPIGVDGSGSGFAHPVCTSVSLVLNDEGGIAPGGPTPGGWYSVTCVDPATGNSVTQTEWIANQVPAAATVPSAYSVALGAEQSIHLPVPTPHLDPAGPSVVNLPTWLWIDGSTWHPYVVTASVGSVSATAVATPQSVTWSMGDGGIEVCQGPGTAYDPALPSAAQSTSCAYTYARSSASQPSSDGVADDGAYPVSSTVTWDVSWTAQGAAGGGALPGLSTTSSTRLRVEQVESVDSVLGGGRGA